MIALFNLLGPTVIRIGADDVDKCQWVPSAVPGPGGPPYSRSIGTAMVDDLADFLNATHAKVIYGVNFDTATPANSTAEATYVMSKLGASVYGFEIGNEINRFGTWATLKPKWESFATAILAANPAAHLIGPAGSLSPPDRASSGRVSRRRVQHVLGSRRARPQQRAHLGPLVARLLLHERQVRRERNRSTARSDSGPAGRCASTDGGWRCNTLGRSRVKTSSASAPC